MTISDSLREHSGHHVGDDFRLMRDAADEIERLQAINTELKGAVDLMMKEIVASGNWTAKDFGWPKAVAAAKAVQRHFQNAK
jgi:hypothetical protein